LDLVFTPGALREFLDCASPAASGLNVIHFSVPACALEPNAKQNAKAAAMAVKPRRVVIFGMIILPSKLFLWRQR
jgi:hypothetical protein